MYRLTPARLFSLAVLLAFAGCSNSGGTAGEVRPSSEFLVLRTEPAENGTLYLNEPIRIDFTQPIDLDSVDLSTFSFQVLDQLGRVIAEPPAGSFVLDRSPGDAEVGRRLLFVPRLPTNDSFTNGGFRPGRTYIVQLVGGDRINGTVLRDTRGRALLQPVTFRVHTSDGTTLDQLFRNTVAGGPRRTSLSITPSPDSTGVVLNKLGAPPVEIRLGFDQPLNPSSTNVPVALDTDPLVRDDNSRGRIYLAYDDPDPAYGLNKWIPADVELESNTFTGSTVLLRPVGVLPSNATIRVIVDAALEDISGESNTSNASYLPLFGSFQTKRAYEQQFDALVDDFQTADHVDFEAAFAEPQAEVGPGYVKAGFDFEGTVTTVEFDPVAATTVLNTNFTQVVPKQGSPYNVSGGVFSFKSVNIGAGKVVSGQGSNPMVWLVNESFTVDGTLSVRGGDGTRVNTAGTANVAKAGGIGQCGGGDGGAGSPSTVQRDEFGETGNGPLQTTSGGGVGGLLSYAAGCNRGSGGGGGSLATQGDPNFKQKSIASGADTPLNPQPIFEQQDGVGGLGCLGIAGAVTRGGLSGGSAGPKVFVDTRRDNDFWGSGLDFRRSLRITGELSVPVGGGGGGGGGDLSYNSSGDVNDANFLSDSSGGGGGGGGGVLIVKALGPIIIGPAGRITADGGNGGGGEPSASCARGGGGGGGAGGMVILMSASRIEFTAHGGTYAANDYNFAISADGGVCQTGSGSPAIPGKYPNSGVAITTTWAKLYDSAPLGGFGGMGIVQLMAPTGTDADGTHTVLDDNIRVLGAAGELTGAAKSAMIAWRGFPDAQGIGRNDLNEAITIGDSEGDIRPSPVLLPCPFGPKTRLRSRWIDTGFTARSPLVNLDDPRVVNTATGDVTGPWYEFQGVDTLTGFANTTVASGRAKVVYPEIGTATAISKVDAAATFQGRPAYRVELASAALGTIADRYVQYEAEALTALNVRVGSFRILSHTASVLLLSPESGAFPPAATKIQLRAKFFQVTTNGEDGVGPTYVGAGGAQVPIANVRIGFAFHKDPGDSTAARFPTDDGTFLYNLSEAAVQEQVRLLGMPFVQWDITFDGQFRRSGADTPPAFGATTPRPELQWLRLPFRF